MILTIIGAIIIFSIIIFVHELGHFIAAKAFGVNVLEFAIGMGPAIWEKKGKETLYSIRAVPMGGFCKMEGEDEDTAEYCALWLEEQGFVNDESYAAAVARHYAAKGYGAGRVRAELSRRGVPRDFWDDALETMPSGDEKIDKFISARLNDPEDRDQIRKISAALYRRGYSWEEIRGALARHDADTEEY